MIKVDAVEARVLGVLVEKQMTTPDVYPLTLAGLIAGCNQATSREPLMSVDAAEAEAALAHLHEIGLATPVRRPSDRVLKFRHKLAEALELDQPAVAVLAVLLLRGAQTAGELRQRTERFVPFETLEAVDLVIDRLEEFGLARRLTRQPGQSQRRVQQLMSDDGAEVDDGQSLAEVEADNRIETRLTALEMRFDELLTRLGVEDL